MFEKDANGHFRVCPSLQGCYTQGDTYEVVLSHLKDAIRLHVKGRLEAGEEGPQPELVAFTSLDVAV